MNRPSHVRSFLAASVTSREAIEAIAQAIQPLRRFRGVKWVPPQQFHYTLKFLGDVESTRIPSISAVIDEICGSHTSFELVLEGAGYFPPRGDVRIVWVGATAGATNLEELTTDLDTGLARLDFPAESRPFSAHLTIGRVKDPREARGIREAVVEITQRFGSQTISEVVLYKSDLQPAGPIYTPLHRGALRAPA